MNFDNFVNTYGVFILILVYVFVNLAYKNLLNLIIFIVVLVATMGIFENKINAVILAYIISILYGIVKNFHLVENFKSNKNKDPVESLVDEQESEMEINIMESQNIIKENEKKDVPDMEFISTKLIQKFVKRLKEIDNSQILYKKYELDELSPTVKNISIKKLQEVTESIKKGKINKVYVSREKFILDGHYTWYALKNLSNTNDAKYGDTIDVILIDMPINKLIQTLQDYKIDFNKEQYDQFKLDSQKMEQAEKSIKSIKIHVKKLEDFHKNLRKVNLV